MPAREDVLPTTAEHVFFPGDKALKVVVAAHPPRRAYLVVLLLASITVAPVLPVLLGVPMSSGVSVSLVIIFIVMLIVTATLSPAVLVPARREALPYRESVMISRSIAGYRDGKLVLRGAVLGRFTPGYLHIHGEWRYVYVRTTQRYTSTETHFIPIPFRRGGGGVLDYRYAAGRGYVFFTDKNGIGNALIPAYCSSDVCVAVLDPAHLPSTREDIELSAPDKGAYAYVRIRQGVLEGRLTRVSGGRGKLRLLLRYSSEETSIEHELAALREPGSTDIHHNLGPAEPVVLVLPRNHVRLDVAAEKMGCRSPCGIGASVSYKPVALELWLGREKLASHTLP